MSEKVLFVDDEYAALEGYQRMLYREFQVETAVGGERALAAIQASGPFAVIVSDMRMPGMSGAQFLACARREAPDAVRMLLTGYTDLDAAMEAVNEGHIFRFLTKPCKKELLEAAITSGLAQHRLMTAEKELLEKTLMGSIKVLTDFLGAASPEAFGRSMRIASYVHHLVGKYSLPSPWRFEAAAMLSQLGCVTLDTALIQAAYLGTPLSPEEQTRFDAHPKAACDLLLNIPRMESIGWMISQQLVKDIPETVPGMPVEAAADIVRGAQILKLALAFDNLRLMKVPNDEIIARLRSRNAEFDGKLVDELRGIKPQEARMELRKVPVSKLATGMILQQDIRTSLGVLVVAKGQEVTRALLNKLDNFSRVGAIEKEIMALVPA
jgi:FixJ family two-component response regulator